MNPIIRHKKVGRSLSWLVIAIAGLVLLGWAIDNEYLKRIVPGFVQMNPLSALLFILSAACFLNISALKTKPALLLSSLVCAISWVRLCGYYPPVDVHIDELLFHNSLAGNRMAPNTSFNFFMLGLSLSVLAAGGRNKRYMGLAQGFSMLAFVVSLFAVIGYLYASLTLYQLRTFIPMAVHTASCFLLITTSVLLYSSHTGFMSVIFDGNNGGKLARRLIPFAIVLPVMLGWLRYVGQRLHLYEHEFGTALLIISIICIFVPVIWVQARSLNKSDRLKKKAEHELIQARRIAENAQKTQEQFLANMSHEIRTPMNGVIGMTNLLSNTRLDTTQREYVNTVKESAGNLLVIINDILDFNKIASGKLVFEKIDFLLRDVVQNVINITCYRAEEKGLELSCTYDKGIAPAYVGDPVRLSQVLMNLIGNAIKFTDEGSVKIHVQLIEDTRLASTLRFCVTDTGIGIPADMIQAVFESFTQASDSTTRRYGGTGLGLTITRKLVELQNGLLTVSSEEGKGSIFSAEITYAKGEANVQKQVEVNTGGIHSKIFAGLKILLVEDNKINQKVAVYTMQSWGAQTDIAENGNEAISMLSRNEYDLILMDLQMPEMDGFETTRFIRRNMGNGISKIPIIAMTASAIVSERANCLRMGMNDYISKPFQANDLKEKIFQVLDISKN